MLVERGEQGIQVTLWPEEDQRLRTQFKSAQDAQRTALTYETWRDEFLTQVAVAWVLGCVFVRFMEDNGLIDEAWLSGPGCGILDIAAHPGAEFGGSACSQSAHMGV